MNDKNSTDQFPTFRKIGRAIVRGIRNTVMRGSNTVPLLAVLGIPLAGWGLGALINPTGWASRDPLIILLGTYYVVHFWYAALFVLVILFLIARYATRAIWNTTILTISVLYAIFIFHLVSTADESEFA